MTETVVLGGGTVWPPVRRYGPTLHGENGAPTGDAPTNRLERARVHSLLSWLVTAARRATA